MPAIRHSTGLHLKLYHMPGACSLAELIVLQWVDVLHELVRMSLDTIKSPDYLAINAAGTVPLLQHGNFVLTENVAILGYLADLNPEARLLGDGRPRARAEVMRWLGFLNSDVHQAFKPMFTPTRFIPDASFAPALAESARNRVHGYLGRLDDRLAGRNWLTGERSLADAYLLVVCRLSASKGVDMHGLDNLARFSDRMHQDAGVRAALASEAGVPAKGQLLAARSPSW